MAAADKDKWLAAMKEVMTTTWTMKWKKNRTHSAQLNAQGYKQVEGLDYNVDSTPAPATNNTTRVMHVLAELAG
jgi:hypothetical protein